MLDSCAWLADPSFGNITVCDDGVWIDGALAARRSATLDALLGDALVLASVPGDRSRHVQSIHFFGGATQVGCAASPSGPFLCAGGAFADAVAVRAHLYCDAVPDVSDRCGDSSADPPRLTGAVPAPLPSPDLSTPPPVAYLRGPMIDAPVENARCQIELFVAVPSLCNHPELGPRSRAAARLEVLVERAYSSASAGFGGAGARELTYGEVATHGILQLLGVGPGGSPALPGLGEPGTSLLDVGSGVGKLVLATPLLTGAAAIGVEVVAERHALAVEALQRAVASGSLNPEQAARVRLVQADATHGLPDATHAYFSNLCFSPTLDLLIARSLVAIPSLRCVVALRPLPLEALAAERLAGARGDPGECILKRVGSVQLQMTWTDAFPALKYCCVREAAGGAAA